MMSKIEIINRQDKFRNVDFGVRNVDIVRAVRRTLVSEKCPTAQVDVVLVDNKTIKKLNQQFLRHNYVTDVIAFPALDRQKPSTPNSQLLGEVVVSVERASDEARRRGITTREEILRYVIHGVLHLLGYRDKCPADKKRMWARQEEILGKIQISKSKNQN